jgi:hypothetical protein
MARNLFVLDCARWNGALMFQRHPQTPRGARVMTDSRDQHALEAWERQTLGGTVKPMVVETPCVVQVRTHPYVPFMH